MGREKIMCPRCGSCEAQRDGSARNGKQRYRCKICGKSYVARDAKMEVVRIVAIALIAEGVPVPVISKAMRRYCSRRTLYNLRASVINGRQNQ